MVIRQYFSHSGTQIRFGLDGLIGLIPGIGDAAGAVISSHILTQAAQMGVPKSILLKMAFNIGLDAILGIIPVLGDVSDFMWKANQRNVQLLNDYLEQPEKTVTHSRLFVGLLVSWHLRCSFYQYVRLSADPLALVVSRRGLI